MPVEIGRIEALFRYPVKSMRGESLDSVELGWHGFEADRRLGFRRLDERGGFPWLTAGKLPGLVRYSPTASGHVRTPAGEELPVFSDALAAEVGRSFGAPVQMMELRHGIFDDAAISVIASDTVREICEDAGVPADVRRFRPNILVRLALPEAFQEDGWVGSVLRFGDEREGPAVSVTMRDLRCGMVNLDPENAVAAPEVLKAVVRRNQTNAGVYATVIRTGRLVVGQGIYVG